LVKVFSKDLVKMCGWSPQFDFVADCKFFFRFSRSS